MEDIEGDCDNDKKYCQPQAYFACDGECLISPDVITQCDGEEYEADGGEKIFCGWYEFH